jgi:hypothetical protein
MVRKTGGTEDGSGLRDDQADEPRAYSCRDSESARNIERPEDRDEDFPADVAAYNAPHEYNRVLSEGLFRNQTFRSE